MSRYWRLARDRRAVFGATILAAFVLVALLAPLISPADPIAQRDVLRTRFLEPLATDPAGMRHWLGTDAFGRDILSRIIYGTRISLTVGLLSVGVSLVLGVGIGAIAAMRGGATEKALMAATDAALAIPRLVLLLALVALWQPSFVLVVLVLGFTGWMSIARLARAEVKALMNRPFIDAARAAGINAPRLLRHHLLPNVLTPVLIAASLGVANAITLEAGLSFLGLGVPAPAPSWGNMIASGRDALVNAPWVATFPGIAVVLSVVACHLFAEGARAAFGRR